MKSYRDAVNRYLLERVEAMPSSQLTRAIRYAFEAGGKRVRPAIVLMVAEQLGALPPLGPAAAVECFHIASLIADDLPCMDDADARRDQPSLHKVFGQATALLVTYALISEGYGALVDNETAASLAARNTGVWGLTGGQCEDLHSGALTEGGLEQLIWMKTGVLFEMAFLFGWLYGAGDPSLIPEVSQLAKAYALAFQIADDLADQEEDALSRSTINYALAFGAQRAIERFEQAMEIYLIGLRRTRLECDQLIRLQPLLPAPAVS